MIGQNVLDKDGNLASPSGKKLAPSNYQPPHVVKELFRRVQRDYQTAYGLQNKPLDEFDGHSLLQRAKLDQETFAAFVGLAYEPKHKRWRWKGRPNTARNKLITILAHLIAGMLFPNVHAQNEQDEEDKMTARVARILIEDKLKSAGYELKFFFAVLSALVNPAVFVEAEYVQELINLRQRNAKGEMEVKKVVDEFFSGFLLHIIPLDEIMLGDFYSGTCDVQRQPFIFRIRRISYEQAKGKYQGRFYLDGKDLFDHVEAGKTRCIGTDAEKQLFDIEWDDADGNFVQEVTVRYRKDDLELTWVGGVGMFDHEHPYDNPITHRRMTYAQGEWYSIPLYPFAMGGFEPIDPTGRFAWFKSGAFKEYWDDMKQGELDRLLVDGIKLDVMKPTFLAGVAKVDQGVMVPGATVTMPMGATMTPYALGPNLVAAYQAITEAKQDMSESTSDKIMQGVTEPDVTATQTIEARTNARKFLGVFGLMMANLVTQIGELALDCVIQYDTVGDLEELTAGSTKMKFKTVLARGKEKGKNVTNRVIFTDKYIGRNISKARQREIEWSLYDKSGGEKSDQRIWEVNPYRFARTRYSLSIEADQIVLKATGTDRMEKNEAYEKLMDPRALPFIDPEAVVQDFLIEEYGQGDPDRYKKKAGQEELIEAMLAQAGSTLSAPTQTI